MIKLKNVSFKYSKDDVILKDANITFDKKITVILGENGIGKTHSLV